MGRASSGKAARRKARLGKKGGNSHRDPSDWRQCGPLTPQSTQEEWLAQGIREWEASQPRNPRESLLGRGMPLHRFDADTRELVNRVEALHDMLTARGWEFTPAESSDGMVSWHWPPSTCDPDTDDADHWTSFSISTPDDPEDTSPFEAQLILTGHRLDDGYWETDIDTLCAHLDTIEAYRHRDPVDEFPIPYQVNNFTDILNEPAFAGLVGKR